MVSFDKAGIKYEYEPEGFDLGELGNYLPDFYLPQVDMYAEVKGKSFTIDELDKAQELANQSSKTVLLLTGSPSRNNYWGVKAGGLCWERKIGHKTFLTCDYEIFEGSFYWLDEGRFYANSGYGVDTFPDPHPVSHREYEEYECEPVLAANSARFEYGECGETSY